MIDQAAIPDLDDAELAQLESYGTRRVARPGEYLYRAGDADYDFYVVLSGLVEIVVGVDGEEQVIVQHGPGRFLGELNLLTGLRVFVSARVAETSEVLQIPVEEFRRIIATQPQLSDKILVTFMARRNELLTGAGSTTRVIGSRFSPDVLQLREFLVAHADPLRMARSRRGSARPGRPRAIRPRVLGPSRGRLLGHRASARDAGIAGPAPRSDP